MKLQANIIKSMFLLFTFTVSELSIDIIRNVNNNLLKNKDMEYSIVNPFYGLMFRYGALHNMRMYYHKIVPGYDESYSRNYIKDEGSDMLSKLLIVLFPSPGGNVCAFTQGNDNFAKVCFSGTNELRNKSIEMLGLTFCSLLNNENVIGYESWYQCCDITDTAKRRKQTKRQREAIMPFVNAINNSRDNLPLSLLTIHAFVIEVLENEDEYTVYLSTILERVKHNEVMLQEYSTHALRCIQKDDTSTDVTQPGQVNGSMLKNTTEYDIMNILFNTKVDRYPYSKKCMPVSNVSLPVYDRNNDVNVSDETFSDCCEITLLHLCNILFYDESSGRYNLEHLKLHPKSDIRKFYEINNEPGEITLSMRKEWLKVVECLCDITNGQNESIGKIKYEKNNNGCENEIMSGYMNVVRILTKICMSDDNDVLHTYEQLFNNSSVNECTLYDKIVRLLNTITAENVKVSCKSDNIGLRECRNEYYGILYITVEYSAGEIETSTMMLFNMCEYHASSAFVSRNSSQTTNMIQCFYLYETDNKRNDIECVLRAHIAGVYNTDIKSTQNNWFDILYNQDRLLTNEHKVDHLIYMYNHMDKPEITKCEVDIIIKVCELVVKSATLEDIATRWMFMPFYIKISDLYHTLNVNDKMNIWHSLNSHSSMKYTKDSYIVKLWDNELPIMFGNADEFRLHNMSYEEIILLLERTSSIMKFKTTVVLDFYYCENHSSLFDALKKHLYVENILLSRNGFTNTGVKNLVDILLCARCRRESTCKNGADLISQLCGSMQSEMSVCDIVHKDSCTTECDDHIHDGLMNKNSNLVKLDLRCNRINDEGVCHLLYALLSDNCNLTTLILSENDIEENGVRCVSIALMHSNSKLTSLALDSNDIGSVGSKHLSMALMHKNCKLTDLNIACCDIGFQGIAYICNALVHENCKLQRLNISENDCNAKGAKPICDALVNSNCVLTELNLNGSTDNYIVLESICNEKIDERYKHNMKATTIGNDGVTYITEALTNASCKLTTLHVSWNMIDAQGFAVIAEALKHENCKLTTLDVGSNKCGIEGALHINEALKHENNKLTSLDLSRNKVCDEGARHVVDALVHENCKLTTLDLSYNKLTCKGAKYIADVLKHENCTLTSLKLSHNDIGNEGAKCIFDAIVHENCKLTSLDISNTLIESDIAKYIAKILQDKNCNLTYLNLTSNMFALNDSIAIAKALSSDICQSRKTKIVGL